MLSLNRRRFVFILSPPPTIWTSLSFHFLVVPVPVPLSSEEPADQTVPTPFLHCGNVFRQRAALLALPSTFYSLLSSDSTMLLSLKRGPWRAGPGGFLLPAEAALADGAASTWQRQAKRKAPDLEYSRSWELKELTPSYTFEEFFNNFSTIKLSGCFKPISITSTHKW